MIDLHTHTSYSDGTWGLSDLLKEAQKVGLEVLSITDHDTLDAYKELKKIDYKKLYTGKIIPGIELNTVYNGVAFHMLAYNFECEKLEEWVRNKYENKKPNLDVEFDIMMNSCKKNNIIIDDLKYDAKDGWPIDIIFPEIKKHEENKKYFTVDEWNNIDVFFNSCVTNRDFPVFVDFSIHYPNAKEVSNEVRKAGGKLFLAHVYKYKLKEPLEFINSLKKDNIIDGVEVYHSSFSDEQTKTLEKYCIENKLLMSGGSDCHGEKKPDRKIGTGYNNLNISSKILKNW